MVDYFIDRIFRWYISNKPLWQYYFRRESRSNMWAPLVHICARVWVHVPLTAEVGLLTYIYLADDDSHIQGARLSSVIASDCNAECIWSTIGYWLHSICQNHHGMKTLLYPTTRMVANMYIYWRLYATQCMTCALLVHQLSDHMVSTVTIVSSQYAAQSIICY